MKKIIVIYKSSTGFTKKYAEMIAREINGALADFKTITAEMLSEYDSIVFGSRAHAGRIDGYKKAREIFQKSTANQMILFVTGATPNTAKEVIEEFWSRNLFAKEMANVPHFYMQSGLCYEKMAFTDKLMMKVFAVMVKKKKDKNRYEKELEQAVAGSYDISSKAYIEPLVSFIKNDVGGL